MSLKEALAHPIKRAIRNSRSMVFTQHSDPSQWQVGQDAELGSPVCSAFMRRNPTFLNFRRQMKLRKQPSLGHRFKRTPHFRTDAGTAGSELFDSAYLSPAQLELQAADGYPPAHVPLSTQLDRIRENAQGRKEYLRRLLVKV
jgi:hypothetical protein